MAANNYGLIATQYEFEINSDNTVVIRQKYYPYEEEFIYVESIKVPISLLERIVQTHKKDSDNQ